MSDDTFKEFIVKFDEQNTQQVEYGAMLARFGGVEPIESAEVESNISFASTVSLSPRVSRLLSSPRKPVGLVNSNNAAVAVLQAKAPGRNGRLLKVLEEQDKANGTQGIAKRIDEIEKKIQPQVRDISYWNCYGKLPIVG